MTGRTIHFVMCVAIALMQLLASARTRAADAQAAHPALSPQESLKQIVVDKGLAVELVAHEPNVIDPVAIRFDEDGRMWVVEMRDYPTGPTKEFPARSRISILRDMDGDGFYESAGVFADNLNFATGLQPWKGGVFVTLAGKVMYMKDTDGDDKADVTETWYTGFAQGNQQLRANHPTLALDGHIYIAAGLRGGTISDPQQPDAKPVSISGMDFRFDPLTRKFEAVTGNGQFGLTFDDYGNRFVCSNRNPVIHVVLEDWQLKKNPLVAVAAVSNDVAKSGADSRVFPIARAWTTSNLHAGQFTAACAVHIYRGSALPSEYYSNVFTCEPTGHLVHREIMAPHGSTFTSKPAAEGVEFFASHDEWCSPVNLEVGPDGALYVVDMYRQIIEHPEWMPDELKKRPNLRAGNDQGRIFRVVPKGVRHSKSPQLSKMSAGELVAQLSSPNSWQRETAARLLLERQDKSVVPQLLKVVVDGKSQTAVIHALRLLDQFGALGDKDIITVLMNKDPRIVEQAVEIAAPRFSEPGSFLSHVNDLQPYPDARVRLQVLLAVAPLSPPRLLPQDTWQREAALIATGNHGGEVLDYFSFRQLDQPNGTDQRERFILDLARLAAASPDQSQAVMALDVLVKKNSAYQFPALTALLTEASRRGRSLQSLAAGLEEPVRKQLFRILKDAVADATDADAPLASRLEAIGLVAFTDDATKLLLPIVSQDPDQSVRLKAIAALATGTDIEPWSELLGKFAKESPAMQHAILDAVLANTDRTTLLLDLIAAGAIKPNAIDPLRAKLILNNKDAALRDRAAKLLAVAVPVDREKALTEYRPALELKADAAHGRAIFEKRCSMCHRINDVGTQLAPDISDSRERTPLQLLTDILQPNRAIDSNYFSYTAVTTDGRVHAGILTAETSTSVTLKQQEGKSETLRRDEIDDLHSDGVSFMPEGLEKDIPPQDMADLISFIKNWRYLENPQEFTPAGK